MEEKHITELSTQIEKLKAENEELHKEQELMYLLLDLTLAGVEEWGRQNGLLPKKSVDDCGADRSNQIRVLLENISEFCEPATRDGFVRILNALDGSK